MPIRVDNDLPAREVLESENIFMMGEERADTQQIRPLEIVILYLTAHEEAGSHNPALAATNSILQSRVGGSAAYLHVPLPS